MKTDKDYIEGHVVDYHVGTDEDTPIPTIELFPEFDKTGQLVSVDSKSTTAIFRGREILPELKQSAFNHFKSHLIRQRLDTPNKTK